jgi:hypothetical protein
MVGSVVMPDTIVPCFMAAMKVCPALTGSHDVEELADTAMATRLAML